VLREDAQEVCMDLHEAGINTRICTGDHRECAIKIARDVGILGHEDEHLQGDVVISGEKLR